MTTSKPPRPATTDTDDERLDVHRSLGRLDRVARLMDEQFKLPVVGSRVGLDPILGLLPGGGDWATWVVSIYIFWESLRLGAPKRMLARMIGNITVDLVTGYVPILGDAFDAAFKANRKNVDMILEFYGAKKGAKELRFPTDLPVPADQERQKPGLLHYLVGFVIVLMLLAVAAAPLLLLWWLIQ